MLSIEQIKRKDEVKKKQENQIPCKSEGGVVYPDRLLVIKSNIVSNTGKSSLFISSCPSDRLCYTTTHLSSLSIQLQSF